MACTSIRRCATRLWRRYKKLNLPTYWAGINSDLTAQFDGGGKVTKVEISYPRDYVKQQLAYSALYPLVK